MDASAASEWMDASAASEWMDASAASEWMDASASGCLEVALDGTRAARAAPGTRVP
jgi:hypothetical protein